MSYTSEDIKKASELIGEKQIEKINLLTKILYILNFTI